jgi:prevent-host-death family protein
VDTAKRGRYDLFDLFGGAVSKSASVADVKAHFADWIRTAESGESVVITRHGKAVVALVPAGDLAQLQRLRAAGPEKGLASIAGGWEGSDELVERIQEFQRSRQREIADAD